MSCHFLNGLPVEHGMALLSDQRERESGLRGILRQGVQAIHPESNYAVPLRRILRGQFKALVDRYEKGGQKIEAPRGR